MATRCVIWPFSTEHDGTVRDIVAALALLAEAVILELQHGGEGEGVVGAREVDVLRANAGIWPEDVLGVVAGDGGNRPELVVHVDPRLRAAADHATDPHQWLLQVLRARLWSR